jgi:hypothetical protein
MRTLAAYWLFSPCSAQGDRHRMARRRCGTGLLFLKKSILQKRRIHMKEDWRHYDQQSEMAFLVAFKGVALVFLTWHTSLVRADEAAN